MQTSQAPLAPLAAAAALHRAQYCAAPEVTRPAGSARFHLLPRVQATNSGSISWTSRILRISRKLLEITGRRCRLGQTVKKLGRAREGRSPFELSIVPSGVYGGHGAIFASENPIFQRKNRFLAVSAPEKSLIFSGDW